jgi:hypothetical protein
MTAATCAYYYFSIQFRENLLVACRLYPRDPALRRLLEDQASKLVSVECKTDKLSPWPDVALDGEPRDHDKFMHGY